MNIVLDTNVLVAGLLTPFGPCGDIVRMIASGVITPCYDARILSEYAEVLRRPKFKLQEDKIAALLDSIEHGGCLAVSIPVKGPLPDRDDEPFLEVALAARAAFLVTGNIYHYPSNLRQGIEVVSPREFLTLYRRQQEKRQPAK